MKNKPEYMVVLIALLAAAAKLYCAGTTLGTIDMVFFEGFGRFIAQEGVIRMYEKSALFNHPPLLGNYLGLAYAWSGGNDQLCAFYNRLPGIVADFAVVLLMLWVRRRTGRPAWWALCLLAASPVSFMISGFHGNFDPLIPLALVLTVAASMQRRALLAGVLLGVACQVKIIPLIMSPVLFFYWWHRGKGPTFAVAAGVVLLLGWCAPILVIPGIFARHVLVYNSIWGWWGFTYLFNISGLPGLAGVVSLKPLTPAQAVVVQILKIGIIVGVLVVAWRRRKVPAEEMLATMGLVWALFFSFAPGFGVQYLAWAGPFLLFYSARWFTAFTVAASVALFVFYNTISHGIPWQKGFGLEKTFGTWAPWLLLPWAVFAALAFTSRKEFGIGSASPAEHPTNAAEMEMGKDALPVAVP